MRPIQGATYRHYKGGLYIVTGFSFDEGTGKEQVLYASLKDAVQYNQDVTRFCGTVAMGTPTERPRFELEIPPQPSIGLATAGYLWTNSSTGHQMVTLPDDPIQERDMPGITREALVRLSHAFEKWQYERVQSMSRELKHTT